MNIYLDNRIVMTLDAGGTNFVFSAIKGGKEIIEPIILSSSSHDLELCLQQIINGFKQIKEQLLPEKPVAISFAFPGPADYKNGIIGDLPNFPSFSGGVALGPMLEETFGLPTFINNDGDLFTYGEAMAGFLPELNNLLQLNEIDKTYRNLFGITLGTGFGGGIVVDGKIFEGDNSAGGEIWLMRNFYNKNLFAEEGVSIRAVQRVYKEISGDKDLRSPKEIYDIAIGEANGNREAALEAYDEMALNIAESLANAVTLIDGPIVIGGGISGASQLILPKIIKHLNGDIENIRGDKFSRLVSKVYNFEDNASCKEFLNWKGQLIKIPFSSKEINYMREKKLVIGLSKLGTSKAVCLGAYAYALANIDVAKKAIIH
ncbi:ROK family protein [Zhouia sp. PK063]|uniref:ROK family protein n=1 Tax=Zhouia sp. PK063 TaxID=3373602 RepID=UPI003788E921